MKRLSIALVAALFIGFICCTPEQEPQEIAVESISIEQGDQILNVGESIVLSATVLPADAADKFIKWTSSDENIVMVSSSGKVLALALGAAQITAEAGGKTDFVRITVKEKPGSEDDPALTVTGNAEEITATSAKITGYANLPLELGDASFGIIYSTVNPPSVENGTITMAYDMDTNNMYVVNLRGLSSGTTYYYASFVQNGLIYRFGTVKSFSTPVVLVESVELNKTTLTFYNIGATFTLVPTVLPEFATDKSVNWSSSNDAVATVDQFGLVTSVASGNAIITATTKDQNKTASCTVNYSDGVVDLGLSVCWAACNLGAIQPDDYGDYYAWGETETKSDYSWSTYKWCNGRPYSLTKYNNNSSYGTVDNKTVLEPEDDAAHVVLGGNWRLPTSEEAGELYYKCTWEETSENGVNGSMVTGPNGNSIFIPAAGYRDDNRLNSVGYYGSFWCSDLATDDPNGAWDYWFYGRGDFYERNFWLDRFYGQPVRPVIE